MKAETRSVLAELKEHGQDYDWYPTTDEMFAVIEPYLKDVDVLDIGCGDCRFKTYMDKVAQAEAEIKTERAKQEALKENRTYWKTYNIYDRDVARIHNYKVIEKSKILIERYISNNWLIETDFLACSLLDKSYHTYFCNPPYSEWESWLKKILKEGNFVQAFLIIPRDWEDNVEIKSLLKFYNISYEIIGESDFYKADRAARVHVHILRFVRDRYDGYRSLPEFNQDSFDAYFNEVFKTETDRRADYQIERDYETNKKASLRNAIVSAETGKANILVEKYHEDFNKLLTNLQAIMQLDPDIMESFNISVNDIKESLLQKQTNLKKIYWDMIWDEFSEITDRLITEARQMLRQNFEWLQKLEFTVLNIWFVILYVVKHASEYSDHQLISFYKKLSDEENVKPYKSNTKLFEKSSWRWNCDEHSDYLLDYRIIMSSPFRTGWHGEFEVDYYGKNTLADIKVIARNLKFQVTDKIDYPDNFGKKGYMYLLNNGKEEVFMEFKAYKNGNMHVKFNQEFTKALNIEAARLLGWIKSKADVAREMPSEYLEAFDKYYGSNYTAIGTNLKLLATKS